MILHRASILPAVLYTLFGFTSMLLEVPTVRLFEQTICVRYFQDYDVEEASCKGSAVQNILSTIVGWKLTFDACAGVLTAVYYGSIADKYGQRMVLALSTVGYVAMLALDLVICAFPFIFPARILWVSSFFLLLGGGQRIYNSMIFALVADATADENRTIHMYVLALGPHIMRFVSPRVAARLMERSNFAPFWIGLSTLGIILLIVPLVVEKPTKRSWQTSEADYTPIRGSESDSNQGPGGTRCAESTQRDPRSDHRMSCSGAARSFLPRFANMLYEKLREARFLFHTATPLFCLAVVFWKKIGFASSVFAFQFVSEKFGWQLRQTTWLRVSSGAGAILITTVSPILTLRLVRAGYPSPHLDLKSIRVALVILAVSFFAAWCAPNGTFMIFAMFGCGLGEALEPAVQGLTAFATDSLNNSTVFTTFALADGAAELIAGPSMARLLAIGRTDDHPSDGMCFVASSIIFASLFCWTLAIRARKTDADH